MKENEPVLTKSRALEIDEFEGDLILMNVKTGAALMLNPAGLALWESLDPTTRSAAIDLVHEAMPESPRQLIEASVGQLFDDLLAGGFLESAA
jgi:hypothetical protein